VTFRWNGQVLTHRVYDIRGDGAIVTWADALAVRDPPVTGADVLGRAAVVQAAPWFRGRGRLRLGVRRVAAALARARERLGGIRA
jgi:hypothetical protein